MTERNEASPIKRQGVYAVFTEDVRRLYLLKRIVVVAPKGGPIRKIQLFDIVIVFFAEIVTKGFHAKRTIAFAAVFV